MTTPSSLVDGHVHDPTIGKSMGCPRFGCPRRFSALGMPVVDFFAPKGSIIKDPWKPKGQSSKIHGRPKVNHPKFVATPKVNHQKFVASHQGVALGCHVWRLQRHCVAYVRPVFTGRSLTRFVGLETRDRTLPRIFDDKPKSMGCPRFGCPRRFSALGMPVVDFFHEGP